MDEQQLIKIYLANPKEGMDLIISRYKTSLYSFCVHLSRNKQAAEDLFQDTWVKVFHNINKFDMDKNFESWMFTIAINTYRDGYRKAKRWLNRIVDYTDTDEKSKLINNAISTYGVPEEIVLKQESKKALKKAIEKLNDKQKIPLLLYYFKSFSYKQIAEILDIPEGTVKSRINTAKSKLKDYMEEGGYGGQTT